MTETEARKIRSAFSNGYEYPFGGGLIENCDMKEVSRHADLLDDAIKKQIPQKPLPAEENILVSLCYVCPNCYKTFSGTGIADYCYHCGQALDWDE